MQELFETVDRKFIESYEINDFEILTDSGWIDADAIHKTVEYKIWKLSTPSYTLKCADNHIVFKKNFEQIFVKNLIVGDLIWTESGLEPVIEIIETDSFDNMYDIELNNNSNHRYYTNNILSHNTTCYTVFCVWLASLFPEKKIMICANKLQTSIEIMDRIRIGYEYLPQWIKPGIVVYNKQEITFSNKSTIRAFATSSSASRGFSGNCVHPDTKVTIRLFKCLKMSVPIKWLKFVCL